MTGFIGHSLVKVQIFYTQADIWGGRGGDGRGIREVYFKGSEVSHIFYNENDMLLCSSFIAGLFLRLPS